MSVAAGRKKSVISSTGLQIDTPVAHNTFLNKSAASSTSLYQQCSQLRARLLRIHGFAPFFAISNHQSRTSVDPVTQLWDCFALGVPLCFLHNLLPGVSPIAHIDTNTESVDPSNVRTTKNAIVHFAMALNNTDIYETESDHFRATELLDRSSTEGLVKVVNCVTRLVDRLPDSCFQEEPPMSPPSLTAHDSTDSLGNLESPMQTGSVSARETARNNRVREIIETERKYVQELEHMQKYALALSSSNAIDQDTIHLLFPGLSKLLNFQRRFLIKIEGVAELPWKEQRWGLQFIENEEEFAVYEPYCANYNEALEMSLIVKQNLMAVTLINAEELPAYLIKPIQRVCKYPLLLEELLKAASKDEEYPYCDELKEGVNAVKRIAAKINEAQRRAENAQTVTNLEARVEDWKGHHLSNFGELVLEDVFMVMKMDIDREYHVFLFEKIILCCKEVAAPANYGGSVRKISKNSSILKKQVPALMGGAGSHKKSTPLLLKGRIFLNNVTHTRPSIMPGPTTPQYSLQVWWRGDDDNEYFTLRCHSEDQLKKWESAINRLIEKTQARRGSERSFSSMQANSTNPSHLRHPYDTSRKLSSASSNYINMASPISGPSSATSGPSSATRRFPHTGFEYEEYRARDNISGVPAGSYYSNGNGAGPSGYPEDVGYDMEDEFDEYTSGRSYASSSGKGNPVNVRRGATQSMMQERDSVTGYDRPRARTEDQNGAVLRQWRKTGQAMPPPPPPPAGALPNPLGGLGRPQAPERMPSDASFGTGIAHRPQPTLRSKFSSNRLNSTYDGESERSASPLARGPRPTTRSRSASQPSAYHLPPVSQPPPLPKSHWTELTNSSVSGSVTSSAGSKRGSGSSESTGESSEYSPHSTSPITPYGSSDSSLAGSTLRGSKSQILPKSNVKIPSQVNLLPLVKVKVHFADDIFAIQVQRNTEFEELVEKIGKKVRLCGPRRDDGPLKIKYIDEDGDKVSLGSTEDVQMAFDTLQSQSQVTLYVS